MSTVLGNIITNCVHVIYLYIHVATFVHSLSHFRYTVLGKCLHVPLGDTHNTLLAMITFWPQLYYGIYYMYLQVMHDSRPPSSAYKKHWNPGTGLCMMCITVLYPLHSLVALLFVTSFPGSPNFSVYIIRKEGESGFQSHMTNIGTTSWNSGVARIFRKGGGLTAGREVPEKFCRAMPPN